MADPINSQPDVKRLLDAGAKLAGPQRCDAEHHPYAVVPNDCKLIPIPEVPRDRPRRKEGKAFFYDLDSFIDALNKHKIAGETEVFASEDVIRAVLNSHGSQDAGHGDNVLVLLLAETDEWRAWQGVIKNGLTQIRFAEFLDQYIHTIAAPDGASLVRLIRDLQLTRSVQFRQAVNLDDGSVNLAYTNQVEQGQPAARGDIRLPSELVIVVRMHIGEAPVTLRVRLRFRLDDERHTVKFMFFVRDLETTRLEAMNAIGKQIVEKTQVRVWCGSPWNENPARHPAAADTPAEPLF